MNKIPAIKSWSHLQHRQPTQKEIDEYPDTGAILIACGEGSLNLEVLDFDEKHDPTRTTTARWLKNLKTRPSRYGLPVVQTVSGGFHIYYRLEHTPEGNQKLARNKAGEAVIETRGQGGYVIAPPHPAYKVIRGDLNNIPVISNEYHEELIQAAVMLDEMPDVSTFKNYGVSKKTDGTRPGDIYESNTDWLDILSELGWHSPRKGKGDIVYLTRPGKRFGVSGALVTSESGNQLFRCFTSSAAPFEGSTTYSKFGAVTLLQYDGDFKKAASEIYKENVKNSLVCK